MADITVLNAAAANVVYVAASPSAGDNVGATWRANALSSFIGYRPELRITTRDNAKRNGRVFKAVFRFPITGTDSTTSQPFLIATVPFELSGTLPTNVDSAVVNDAFIQMSNLFASTLIRAVANTGYAPT
jgi:hypothetical protein